MPLSTRLGTPSSSSRNGSVVGGAASSSTDVHESLKIAPWGEQLSPIPPKPSSSRFGFAHKPSFPALPLPGFRQPSLTSPLRHPRPSGSNSTLSTDDPPSIRRSADGESIQSSYPSVAESSTLFSEPRQSKISLLSRIRKSRSKTSLRSEDSGDHPSLHAPPPPLPDISSILPLRGKREPKKKSSANEDLQYTNQGHNPAGMTLDLDIDTMDGIIDLSLARDPKISSTGRGSIASDGATGSWKSGVNPNSNSIQSASTSQFTVITPSEFSNPFASSSTASSSCTTDAASTSTEKKKKKHSGKLLQLTDGRSGISPKERTLADSVSKPLPLTPNGGPGNIASFPPPTITTTPAPCATYNNSNNSNSSSSSSDSSNSNSNTTTTSVEVAPFGAWTAPESWAVMEPGKKPSEPEDYSSSDESVSDPTAEPRMSFAPNPNVQHEMEYEYARMPEHLVRSRGLGGLGLELDGMDEMDETGRKEKRRNRHKGKGQRQERVFIIRIYRDDRNQYHNVRLGPNSTVEALLPRLRGELLRPEETEEHRLYIKERGRERLLLNYERPAEIVGKRLEQAGYDPTDCSELLGSEGQHSAYLLKFVFKSQLLRMREPDIAFDDYSHIDLTGRGLRAIPILLHQHADSIISLKLSQNPMLDFPLDFVQSCTGLHDLRLSNMAMKKVPQSIRHATRLVKLDLSSNRISDLDDAVLDDLPDLRHLSLENNRLEKLPWYFPRLHNLVMLNISNNKFRTLPSVVCDLFNLNDFDVSFNLITELPDSIGKLAKLERLTIVGNQITKLPDECASLRALISLDCRRNQIVDLNVVSTLPRLGVLAADHNAVAKLELSLGPSLGQLNASYNEITQLSLAPGRLPGRTPYALTHLDISHAKLSSLDNFALGQLGSLQELNLDYNAFRSIPETLGDLVCLRILSCADNQLDMLPASVGRLVLLEVLDAHNNNLVELPVTLWSCPALKKINLTSNLLGVWHDPPPVPYEPSLSDVELMVSQPCQILGRKTSATSLGSFQSGGRGRPPPPLALSLECLYLGENQFTDDISSVVLMFRKLRVLNLSFNKLQDLPSGFFLNMAFLEELYLSGNKLTSIPTDNLKALNALSVLYLNGNRLQTLPEELGKVKNLSILDVGSNLLKYNVNNWEFDWNWNFNTNLRYLNLSGNNRLQIKPDQDRTHRHSISRKSKVELSGFTDLKQLAVLGLMDVTIAATVDNTRVDIPDENDDRRVRTSSSSVLGMAYGIADAIGRKDPLTMIDLVHEFRDRPGEAMFAMFGTSHSPKTLTPGATHNRLSRHLHDNVVSALTHHLGHLNPALNEGVPDALRRTFLKLNQDLHDSLYMSVRKGSTNSQSGRASAVPDPATIRSGVSGIVVYFVNKTMYVANVGHVQAVVSRQGEPRVLSRRHDPLDRQETGRIRSAEGWVSPAGLVNNEVDMSRAFGYYHLLPVINARPDVFTYEITPNDEFVIIANRGLWDYMSYQTAVDIARGERGDPMIAAQKLRDFAISYGADGSTMIMVIGVNEAKNIEVDLPKRIKTQPHDRNLIRLENEVPAPVGHLALVFSDIRNSTPLWEGNPGMATAHRLHNNLLRRQLRFCGGYEVKTEGDSFMCSFPTATAAVWWCITVQQQLLHVDWPLEILECEDGRPIYDPQGRLVARGLSVRMGIHCGAPSPELDPITHRMDYFGPVVNRSARICGNAAGGQIMCSGDIIREINASILGSEPPTDHSKRQPEQAVQGIKTIGIAVVPVGEVKLKGLEVPEYLSVLYPTELVGRQDWGPAGPTGSRVPFSVEQMQSLGLLCLRLEALTSSRIFRPLPARKGSIQTSLSVDEDFGEGDDYDDEGGSERKLPVEVYGDPAILLPHITASSTDVDMMSLLDSLAARLANAAVALAEMQALRKASEAKTLPEGADEVAKKEDVIEKLKGCKELDERTLDYILSLLGGS